MFRSGLYARAQNCGLEAEQRAKVIDPKAAR
jgi:hypothetical protein